MVLLLYRTGQQVVVGHVVTVQFQSEQWYCYSTGQVIRWWSAILLR